MNEISECIGWAYSIACFFYDFMDKYLGKYKVHAVKFSFEYEMDTLNLCCLEKRDGFSPFKGKNSHKCIPLVLYYYNKTILVSGFI